MTAVQQGSHISHIVVRYLPVCIFIIRNKFEMSDKIYRSCMLCMWLRVRKVNTHGEITTKKERYYEHNKQHHVRVLWERVS